MFYSVGYDSDGQKQVKLDYSSLKSGGLGSMARDIEAMEESQIDQGSLELAYLGDVLNGRRSNYHPFSVMALRLINDGYPEDTMVEIGRAEDNKRVKIICIEATGVGYKAIQNKIIKLRKNDEDE